MENEAVPLASRGQFLEETAGGSLRPELGAWRSLRKQELSSFRVPAHLD